MGASGLELYKVLDKGRIGLLAHTNMSPGLLSVNAARASFNKTVVEFTDKEARLINRLVTDNHKSVFYHWYATFYIKMPISVHRQWERHRIGTAMNSESSRYVDKVDLVNDDIPFEFYTPEIFRGQSPDNKQGSAGVLEPDGQIRARKMYILSAESSFKNYKTMRLLGTTREQARDLLPLGTYTSCVWTASAEAIKHFLFLRDESHAQYEIRQYAIALRKIMKPFFAEMPEFLDATKLDKPLE